MDDIAMAYGWSVEAMAKMDLPELARWRKRARDRLEQQTGRNGG